MSDNKPIFLLGAPRSGTTLLAQYLSQHPEIFIFNECLAYDYAAANSLSGKINADEIRAFIEFLYSRLEARLALEKGSEVEFGCRFSGDEVDEIKVKLNSYLSSLQGPEEFSAVLETFMQAVIASKKKLVWGDKTPNHVFHLNAIYQDYPKAKFIHIVRDPRSFLRSYKFAWRQRGGNPENKKLYHPFVSSLLWNRSVNEFLNFADHSGAMVYELKYEDLVKSPEENMRRICEFIGVEFTPQVMSTDGSNSSFGNKREELSLWEIAVCEAVCGRRITTYNYAQCKTSITRKGMALGSCAFTLGGFIIAALPVIRHRFGGGMLQYLRSRGIFSF